MMSDHDIIIQTLFWVGLIGAVAGAAAAVLIAIYDDSTGI